MNKEIKLKKLSKNTDKKQAKQGIIHYILFGNGCRMKSLFGV